MNCKGCGAQIQFTDSNKPGFIDESVYNKRTIENKPILCERCFRLKNYNEIEKVEIKEEDFLTLVKDNVTNNMLICYIVDVFDLDGTFIKNINDIFPHNPILIIGNKYDLFMRSNRPTKIKKYLQSYLELNNIKVIGSIITSASEVDGSRKVYDSILKTLNALNLTKEVFFFGMSNVGKTTLLRSMATSFSINTNNEFVVSNAVSTTLSVNKIDIGEITIFDTPGIVNPKQVTYYLNKKTIDHIHPKNFIKPIVFQLNPNQTIFVDGFLSCSYLNEERIKNSLIFYFSRSINLHRTKYDEFDDFYNHHKDDLLKYPTKTERKKLGNIVEHQFDVTENDEISISGLGFIGFGGSGKIIIKTFENIYVNKRNKMI